jgi:FtsH-binding integral membrane protein
MWQRIQTVFLVLVVTSMLASIFLPIWVAVDPVSEISKSLYPLHYTVVEGDVRTSTYFPYCATAILMIAAATIAIMQIRRYDNRITQIKMGTLNSLILMGVMLCAILFANSFINANPTGWKYGLGLYLPFVGVTCNWLAIRFIRRDEKMVRDSDRIR